MRAGRASSRSPSRPLGGTRWSGCLARVRWSCGESVWPLASSPTRNSGSSASSRGLRCLACPDRVRLLLPCIFALLCLRTARASRISCIPCDTVSKLEAVDELCPLPCSSMIHPRVAFLSSWRAIRALSMVGVSVGNRPYETGSKSKAKIKMSCSNGCNSLMTPIL